MPVIVQVGKQRVPKGLPLPIVRYAIGESQKKLSDLRGRPVRLRSLLSGESVQVETLEGKGTASPFLYDDVGGVAWWSVVGTKDLPAGVYTADFGSDSAVATSPSAILDEESYKELLAEENDEQFDDNLLVPTSFEELQSVARQVIANHPAISAFRAISLLSGVTTNPIIFSRWSNPHSRRIGSIPRERLRFAIEAFLSDLLYFPFPSPRFGFDRLNDPVFYFNAGFAITERDDVAISGELPVPPRTQAILEPFQTWADIVWLERFHPKLFHSAVSVGQETSAIRLELVVSAH
jgi:hypothetical protein